MEKEKGKEKERAEESLLLALRARRVSLGNTTTHVAGRFER